MVRTGMFAMVHPDLPAWRIISDSTSKCAERHFRLVKNSRDASRKPHCVSRHELFASFLITTDMNRLVRRRAQGMAASVKPRSPMNRSAFPLLQDSKKAG